MFHRAVLLVLIVIFFHQKWTSPHPLGQPYYCDTQEKIDEVSSLDLKRLVYSYTSDRIYLILADKIIFFRGPRMTQMADKEGNFNVLVSQAYYLPHTEQELPDRQPFGYFHNIGNYDASKHQIRSQSIYELYVDELANGSRPFSNKLRKLSFDQTPAERAKTDSPPEAIAAFKPKRDYRDCWTNALLFDSSVYLESSYCVATSVPPAKMFAMYLVAFKSTKLLNLGVLVISKENKVLISEQVIDYDVYLSGTGDPVLQSFSSGDMDFSEFLGCQKKIRHPREIKGVYYVANKFYIFFNRYYIIADKAFAETGRLAPKDSLQAYNFLFEDPDSRFEMANAKWLKTSGEVVYMAPYRQFIYRIELDQNNRVRPMSGQQKSNVGFCPYSTLLIKDNLYCFQDDFYNYMVKRDQTGDFPQQVIKLKIKDIFKGKNVWPKDEKLLFISNYETGKVLFITEMHVWQFKYQHFSVNKDNSLSYDTSTSENYKYTMNNLVKELMEKKTIPYGEASEPETPQTEPSARPHKDEKTTRPSRFTTLTTRSPRPTTTQRKTRPPSISKKSEKNVNQVLITVVILVAAVILILLLALCFIYRKRQEASPASKQSSVEAQIGKPVSSAGVDASTMQPKSPSKESLKSAGTKGKTPSSRSIRSSSKEKRGSKTSLKSNKSISQLKAPTGKSKTSVKSGKSVTQLKSKSNSSLPQK